VPGEREAVLGQNALDLLHERVAFAGAVNVDADASVAT